MLDFIGALVLTYALSRGFSWILQNRLGPILILVICHVASLAVVLWLVFWKAGGLVIGPTYLVAQGAWVLADVYFLKRASA